MLPPYTILAEVDPELASYQQIVAASGIAQRDGIVFCLFTRQGKLVEAFPLRRVQLEVSPSR